VCLLTTEPLVGCPTSVVQFFTKNRLSLSTDEKQAASLKTSSWPSELQSRLIAYCVKKPSLRFTVPRAVIYTFHSLNRSRTAA
jgi:hypothetical protein